MSMSTNEPAGIRTLLEWRDARFAALGDKGYAEKQFTGHGYSYRSRGQVSVGVGRRDCVAQLTGAEASDGWRDLSSIATNVSRADLAVTARIDGGASALAQSEYRAASSAPRGRGRRPQYTLIVSEDRGDTLYVGSKASDQLGRLYDKARESSDATYSNCWRWEVQYRRAYALDAVRQLQAAKDPAATLAATVGGWFRDRGVRAAFASGGDPLAVRSNRPLPDDERWLAWARKCVQPRAKQLVAKYGWRYVAETLAGHIKTYEEYESLMRGVEFEFEARGGEDGR